MDNNLIQWFLFRIAISSVFAIAFHIALLIRKPHKNQAQVSKKLVDAPDGLPILGHALAFSSDMAGFSSKLKKRFNGIPLRLRLMVMNVVYLTEPDHISSLFRRSGELTNGPYRKFVSSTFGVPKDFQKFFAADNTGLSRNPLPGTNVKPEHRVDYLMHTFIVQFMTGKSLKSLARRFTANMEDRLKTQSRAEGSETHDCLYDFVKVNMFHSSVTAMFGKQLFKIDPDFCDHFWRFEEGMPELAKSLPRFIYPKQYKARDVCLQTVRTWQRKLDEQRNRDPDAAYELSVKDYDDFFGSGIVKKRHLAFAKMEVMGVDARASEDLALLWGANSNATHAAFWLIRSIVRDAAVEQRFLTEIRSAKLASDNGDFIRYDLEALCALPFLQSLYAETLRLYVANIILRSPRKTDIPVGDWSIRQDEIVAVMSHPMHHDEAKFNTGSPQDPRPLSEFWAERFIVPQEMGKASQDQDGAKFSLKGTEGAWLPYGGGSNECPGRFFAKQEMLLTAALLIGNFEILLDGDSAEIDWRYFGTGVLGVKGKQPFRLRRRNSKTLFH
ncbi:hypothetical protein EKO04_002455 [Ascochyta lentis]|uniref:Cytochrome P450 n=1 Tax=Ascochyta lentis TaxID=205686 RepID=A0A8H7MGD0_9PLEO|nr:hypothetical protein EKO04_002455 [Ascochyta lentis]